jgi:hypothetical protein
MADVKETGQGVGGGVSRPKSSPKSGVKSAEIERADNDGYVVNVRYEQPKSTKRNAPMQYMEPERHVFTSFPKAVSFLRGSFGGGKPAAEETEE